ncbi:MAG: excinuclease ABC subunit UvrC [Alphaproteobacteria bacterium]|nr:excinuclease ABC subunit UvrC [Alphaproteobacteria bacterium]
MNDIKHGLEVLNQNVKIAPTNPGVYRMISKSGEVLYVGKAKNIKKRIVWYTKFDELPTRLKRMVALVDRMEFVIAQSEADALLIENELIKKYAPKFNILLKDDKSFPYLMIDENEEFPALRKYRGKKEEHIHYFGPFADAGAVKDVNDTLQKAFLLRSCKDTVFKNRTRPCLLYQIKRCSAPCAGKISKEEYKKLVDNVVDFLNAKDTRIQEELAQKMAVASENLNFEEALVLRDRIKALSAIVGGRNVLWGKLKSVDVVALYRKEDLACVAVFMYRNGQNCGNASYFPKQIKEASDEDILEAFISEFYMNHTPPREIYVSHKFDNASFYEKALDVKICKFEKGEKAKLTAQAVFNAKQALERKMSEMTSIEQNLAEMAEVFGLPKVPRRIEVYDNSHNQGSYAVGAMIVATPAGFEKKSYRTFNIKRTENTQDDFAMMKEVLMRRFEHLSSENRPDVVLLDGGVGQLNAVHEALCDYDLSGISIIAVSKGPDRNAGKEFYHQKGKESFMLEYRSSLAFYLQTLRDEAHRFAIGTHRKKRIKSVFRSSLDEIEGIGAKRKKDLLAFFGSAEGVKNAKPEDLQKIDGISKKTAEKIYKYFHK